MIRIEKEGYHNPLFGEDRDGLNGKKL